LTIDPKEHPEIASADRGAINYIYATAECERLYAIKEIVEGSVPFLYHPPTQQQTTTNLPTQPPVTQFQTFTPPQSPTDKIPVPNVIGMTFDDAQKTLEDLGFNTTWINGNSNLELGKIYSQAPVAGTLSVPHRTTVVIYRTTEVVSIPLECAQLNLTPEECANAGTHEYSSSTKITYSDTPTRCGDESNSTYSLTFLFSAENSLQMIYSNEFIVNLKRVDRNSYTGSGITNDGIGKFTYALTFNQNGFINEETMIHIKENRHDCTWVNNNIITK